MYLTEMNVLFTPILEDSKRNYALVRNIVIVREEDIHAWAMSVYIYRRYFTFSNAGGLQNAVFVIKTHHVLQ